MKYAIEVEELGDAVYESKLIIRDDTGKKIGQILIAMLDPEDEKPMAVFLSAAPDLAGVLKVILHTMYGLGYDARQANIMQPRIDEARAALAAAGLEVEK